MVTGNLNAIGPYLLTMAPDNTLPTGSEPHFEITYKAGGTYWVKLLAEDGSGNRREIVKKLTL
jgi:hypothetical protein